jgi:Fuc2NAc and GlcNAc transferase
MEETAIMTPIFSFGCLFIISLLLTMAMRRYALHKKILDIPNHRSSHQLPTPRGGGMAIVLSFTLAVLYLGSIETIPMHLVIALTGGGLAVAAIGYMDDLYHAPTLWRMLGHVCVALWAVFWLQGFPHLDLGTWQFALPHVGILIAVIGIVWCINLYNFMDGIDGLAGSEGLFVALASGLVLWFSGQTHLALMLLLLAAAIAGFTTLNWPPAKIFLGDAGSGFLGYVFSVSALYTANTRTLSLIFWLIILAVFICDATFTLIYRVWQRKKWYAAHREHAYQHLIAYGASHQQVTLSIGVLNIFLVLPVAFLTLQWPYQGFWLMGGMMLLLFVIWLVIKSLKLKDMTL